MYIAGRSESKARAAIKAIEDLTSDEIAAGRLGFLYLELDDLASIKVGFQIRYPRLPIVLSRLNAKYPLV